MLLGLAAIFATYIAAGLLAGPDWGATARGLVVPELPGTTAALVAATATVGTTLAPWASHSSSPTRSTSGSPRTG